MTTTNRGLAAMFLVLSLARCSTKTSDGWDAASAQTAGGGHAGANPGLHATGGHAGRDAGVDATGGHTARDAEFEARDAGGDDAGVHAAGGRAGAHDAGSFTEGGGTGGHARSDASDVFGDAEAGPAAPDGGEPIRLAIPLYVWPGDGTAWSQVAAAGRAVSYIVANAGDPGGPGTSVDMAYTTAIANAHDAQQRVIGYVDTSYADRDLSAVEAEIEQWYGYYPSIDGIFLDLSPASPERIVDYYRPLSERIRAKPGAHVVIINPGQPQFDEAYMAVADIVMSYENPYNSPTDGYGQSTYAAPTWMSKYAANRFWHVILEVPDPIAMKNLLELARARNVGHIYITNYPDPPAYARLPTYLSDEVDVVGR